jgi:N-acetylglutamate synthase-like GNAT family acetyltransferase
MAGFVYGGVLYRRHTRLRHLCVYEVGVDIDHPRAEVGKLLMEGIALEARQMGIEQGFAFAAANDRENRQIYESIGAMKSTDMEILYGIQF